MVCHMKSKDVANAINNSSVFDFCFFFLLKCPLKPWKCNSNLQLMSFSSNRIIYCTKCGIKTNQKKKSCTKKNAVLMSNKICSSSEIWNQGTECFKCPTRTCSTQTLIFCSFHLTLTGLFCCSLLSWEKSEEK